MNQSIRELSDRCSVTRPGVDYDWHGGDHGDLRLRSGPAPPRRRLRVRAEALRQPQ